MGPEDEPEMVVICLCQSEFTTTRTMYSRRFLIRPTVENSGIQNGAKVETDVDSSPRWPN